MKPKKEIVLDEGTVEAIFKLKKVFKTKSLIDTIRKAIALARVVERLATQDGTIIMLDKNQKKFFIDLAG